MCYKTKFGFSKCDPLIEHKTKMKKMLVVFFMMNLNIFITTGYPVCCNWFSEWKQFSDSLIFFLQAGIIILVMSCKLTKFFGYHSKNRLAFEFRHKRITKRCLCHTQRQYTLATSRIERLLSIILLRTKLIKKINIFYCAWVFL